MTQATLILPVLCLVMASAPGLAAAPAGDAARGHDIYDSRCSACHSIDANRVGPAHRGVYGRKAGSAPGYAYSPALRASHVVWTEPTLNRWLTNPQAFIPGARMGFQVADPRDRADVIAWLKANPATQ